MRNKMVLLERYRYDDYTKMLLHGNGSNGSSEMIDFCGFKPLTTKGTVTISTGQSKFGGSSILFDGSTGFISTPDSADFTLGSSNWTIDFWCYLSSLKNYNAVCCQRLSSTESHSFTLMVNSSGNIYFSYTGANTIFVTGITTNTWTHIAVVREGDNIKVYKNGTIAGTYALTTGFSFTDSSYDFIVGASRSALSTYANFYNGYLDEFRFSTGIARWTADFTPPTMQY